ncbi:MAG: hypothetical protein IV106_02785 [Pseudomonas umsongensis]|nr:hypothetical protein [Pseudomonas umsongensis]
MSEVQRFNNLGRPCLNGCFVGSSDYDAAQSELAALRGELAKYEQRDADLVKAMTAIDERLTAAEQRNSQMILVPRHLLMRASHSICRGNDLKELRTFLAGVPKECNTCDDRKLVCLDFEMGEWLDCPSCSKPTESGASE